ncbi:MULTISPECIES: sensor histidine kinase [unclassified Pusillimonas]|uniref:sensor histidine kinase n=1 Tax=unclassified Pusillimonas TaxID=2640016 RepID=UPI000B9CEEBC|nr:MULTISPECIES: sensor histidine kinase [unclassified Pusillimonas]OXR50869.1 two-component sensor histidine kinase [Pusillimonas sp. T2]ROT44731.1 two-component sensor histidine kinase [Pusillimonas sp. NJUB218]
MPIFQQHYERLRSKVRLGLFSRSFLLLGLLMLVSLGAWLEVFFSMEEGPRAIQMAQRVSTSLSITRSALVYAPIDMRPSLLLDLATKESLRIQPRDPSDELEPLPNSNYWNHVVAEIKNRLGPDAQVMWSVNNVPGIWVSFEINDDRFWLVFDREQLGLAGGIEWFWWGVTALLLALVGSAISVRFVNRPLSALAKVTQQLSRGEIPSPLPEDGPLEIQEINIAFNRMTQDLRQTEADREIMLAGISHDLRTPLARMRLEIEMSNVSDETRQAIDQDLAQIDHSIGQLMEYARPATSPPEIGVNVSEVLEDLFDREKSHTETLRGHLNGEIAPGLIVRIAPIDLKRIVSNLIENARRYGRSPIDDTCYIDLNAWAEGNKVIVQVADRGSGIAPSEVQRLLRPFSRGETARTGVSGAGLGLAIVERLLGHVGGRLKLSNRSPNGLVARIELPRG